MKRAGPSPHLIPESDLPSLEEAQAQAPPEITDTLNALVATGVPRIDAIAMLVAQRQGEGDTPAFRALMAEHAVLVQKLADTFGEVLRGWLTSSELRRVIQLNRKESDPGVCHTHDYCDANMAMFDAFQRAFGCEPEPGDNDFHADVWNAAWEVARQGDFGLPSAKKKG